MSQTFQQIIKLVKRQQVNISEHGYDELADDHLFARDIVEGISDAVLLEDYPDYHKGPCVLVLQYDRTGKPVHVVWGIPRGESSPAVLVTAYRPDPLRWTADFKRRKQ